jgi:hypothetical protein
LIMNTLCVLCIGLILHETSMDRKRGAVSVSNFGNIFKYFMVQGNFEFSILQFRTRTKHACTQSDMLICMKIISTISVEVVERSFDLYSRLSPTSTAIHFLPNE